MIVDCLVGVLAALALIVIVVSAFILGFNAGYMSRVKEEKFARGIR